MKEVSYVLITPHTILRSRTGGVLSRLLSRLEDLVFEGARMLAFDEETSREYAESILLFKGKDNLESSQLLHDYILKNFIPKNSKPSRTLLLVFSGKNVVQRLSDMVGVLLSDKDNLETPSGETIRDTYSDVVWDSKEHKNVTYFEPAVLTPRTNEEALHGLNIFLNYMSTKSNLISNIIYKDNAAVERTLVIIKPDNWKYASSRPGTIIDMFARTGLKIIGCKLYQMSVNEALEFYGPVKDTLREKLAPNIAKVEKEELESKHNIKIPDSKLSLLVESFGYAYSDNQFSKIIEFMTGIRPEDYAQKDLDNPGTVKCMVLVYEGANAVERIREVLGPTDPAKAPGGTVRRDFGFDIMVNTAHASDSAENALREMKIVNIEKNNIEKIIKNLIK